MIEGFKAWRSQRQLDKRAKSFGNKLSMVSNTAHTIANAINPKEGRYTSALEFLEDRTYAGEAGATIGALTGVIGGVIGGHLWGRKESIEYDKIKYEFDKSLSKNQLDIKERLRELNDIISTSSSGVHDIGTAFGESASHVAGGLSRIINAKYIVEAKKLGRTLELSYTPKQKNLISRMGALTSTQGLKTLGAMLIGSAAIGTAGYLIDKHAY